MGLLLGNIIFRDLEIPAEIPFSGSYQIARHQLIGGGRVLDAMGDNPDPIEWSGWFRGPSASVRARALDAMKQAGRPIPLSWGTFAYQVVIKEFKPRYQREYQVAYTICVEVVGAGSVIAPSLDDLITLDFSALALFTGLPPDLLAIIAAARAAIRAAALASRTGRLADVSLTGMQPAVAAARTAFDAIDAELARADGLLAELDLDGLPGLSPDEWADAVIGIAGGSGAVSDLVTAQGYAGRIVSNLSLYGG